MCNNNVVNRIMTLSETCETDTDDHFAHWEGEVCPVVGGGRKKGGERTDRRCVLRMCAERPWVCVRRPAERGIGQAAVGSWLVCR